MTKIMCVIPFERLCEDWCFQKAGKNYYGSGRVFQHIEVDGETRQVTIEDTRNLSTSLVQIEEHIAECQYILAELKTLIEWGVFAIVNTQEEFA